jgi:hypothetical protein
MDRQRIDSTHGLTPHVYTCPACHKPARLLVVWPFWECPHCHERLIPADLYPLDKAPDDRPPSESDTTKPPPQQPGEGQPADPAAPPRESWPQAGVRPD